MKEGWLVDFIGLDVAARMMMVMIDVAVAVDDEDGRMTLE